MANRKITDLPALGPEQIVDADLLTIVDVGEVDPGLKNKKLTINSTKQYFNGYYYSVTGGTLSGSVTITGDLNVGGNFTPTNITSPGTGTFGTVFVSGASTFSGAVAFESTVSGGTITATNINASSGSYSNLTVTTLSQLDSGNILDLSGNTATIGTGTFTKVIGTTVTGTTIQGTTVTGTTAQFATGVFTLVSGATVSGPVGSFTTVTGTTGNFAALSGTSITGGAITTPLLTADSGVFTTSLSGAIVTGDTVRTTSVTGISGVFTSNLSGATVTGNFIKGTTLSGVSGVFTTVLSGATVTGQNGNFSNVNVGSGNFGTGTATYFSGTALVGGNITGVSGVYTTQLSGATITGNVGSFTSITAETGTFTNTLAIPSFNTTGNIEASGDLLIRQNATINGNLTVPSGIVSGISGNFTNIAGTDSTFIGTVSGATVTGDVVNATRVNAVTGAFTLLSGTTVTGSTGVFTASVSGQSVLGATATFESGTITGLTATTITGVSNIYATGGTFTNLTGTTISGTTITGATGQFANLNGTSGTFTTLSGTTLNVATGNFTTGTFTNLSGAVITGATGQFALVDATTGTFDEFTTTTFTAITGAFTTITGATGLFTGQNALISGQNVSGERAGFQYVTADTKVESTVIEATGTTGTISGPIHLGASGTFTSRVSGAFITGTTIECVTVTAVTGNFDIANFTETTTGNVEASGYVSGVSGMFTEQMAGAAIFENKYQLSESLAIKSGFNGLSLGPVAVDSGVIITIPSGSVWGIL